MFSVTFPNFDRIVGDALAALDRAGADAMVEIVGKVADAARVAHVYQNRTGDLEASTQPGRVSGSLTSHGGITAEVVADMPYGSFLEERGQWRFLLPAYVRVQDEASSLMISRLDAALHGVLGD